MGVWENRLVSISIYIDIIDKCIYVYVYIFCTHGIANFFLIVFNSFGLCDLSVEFFQITTNLQKIFQYIYWKKNLCLRGPTLLKPVLFTGQIYSVSVMPWAYFIGT